jgi:hypothetical protein
MDIPDCHCNGRKLLYRNISFVSLKHSVSAKLWSTAEIYEIPVIRMQVIWDSRMFMNRELELMWTETGICRYKVTSMLNIFMLTAEWCIDYTQHTVVRNLPWLHGELPFLRVQYPIAHFFLHVHFIFSEFTAYIIWVQWQETMIFNDSKKVCGKELCDVFCQGVCLRVLRRNYEETLNNKFFSAGIAKGDTKNTMRIANCSSKYFNSLIFP